MKNESFRNWLVVGGLIRKDSDILLVANRRRGNLHLGRRGGIDWTPPGGVVDANEKVSDALKREVFEETGIRASFHSEVVYEVSVSFLEWQMLLSVEVFEAVEWSGSLVFHDPDEIVEDADFFSQEQCEVQLETSPIWVREPVLAYLKGEIPSEKSFNYIVKSDNGNNLVVERKQC
jgi:ADP-ribose pyrophosphatase YjhB (NUDIX family)